jgi:quercetin dioxygenase-like cupin family protein
VLIALKRGGHMHEHHADWAITVQGVRGHVEFNVADPAVVLTRGRLLTVAAGMPHHVTGIDESAVLLTIGGAHSPSRPGCEDSIQSRHAIVHSQV